MLPAFVLFSAIWGEPSQQVTTKEEEKKKKVVPPTDSDKGCAASFQNYPNNSQIKTIGE